LELALTLTDLAPQGLELGLVEWVVIGYQHSALYPKDHLTCPIGPDSRQLALVKAMHLRALDSQELWMLRWHQRADEMKRPLLDSSEVFFGIVPLIKDQSDVTDTLTKGAAPLGQFFGHAAEGDRIMLVAGIGVMEQRNITVAGDQQSQTDNTQVVPSFLAVASLRELWSVVETVDKGEKVCGVKKQAPQVETKARDRSGRDFPLDMDDGVFVDTVHVVPKPLTGQLRDLGAQQARQNGLLIPFTDLGLAAWSDTPIEAGDKQVLPHGRALSAALGDMAVDGGSDIELLSHVEGGNQRTKFTDHTLLGLRVGESKDQLLGGADVFLPHDLRLAVDALTLAQVVVRPAADELFNEARH